MLFSVIIPAYNAESTIRKTLNSVLNQTFKDFEIVAIDDGSTDSTPTILKDYTSKDSRVHVYTFKNAGVSVSRQRGINNSNGQFIVFVDSDDTIEPELLSNLYSAIKSYPTTDLIRYQSRIIADSPKKDHERYNYYEPSNSSISGIDAIRTWSIPGKKYAVYWLFAFSRTLFLKNSFPEDLRCYEDVALIPILIGTASLVTTINYVGYNYTYNNSFSLTHANDLATQKSRALDFYKSCEYAVSHFKNLPNVTPHDIDFFEKDYQRRLNGKFNSLSDELKKEFSSIYGK